MRPGESFDFYSNKARQDQTGKDVMKKEKLRVAVTGAAGNLGYDLLFRIASGQMFGEKTEMDLSLLEVKEALPALAGIVMELEDCAIPLIRSVTQTANSEEAFQGADWAILIGSLPRKAGMERKDLLQVNGKIFAEQGKILSEHAKPTCRVLVVGNPCNTNAYIAKSLAPNIPAENFFAMTMLDQNRARAQLAKKAGVTIEKVKNIAVWGNHSATQYPDFYNATIEDRPAPEVIQDEKWLQNVFIETVQQRGTAIIKARGVSSAASAAHAIVDTVKNLRTPTREGEFFSLAVSSDGSYGIEKGLMFSYPVRSNGTKWEIVPGIVHDDFSRKKIDATRQELLAEREAVKDLLGQRVHE
jgi:malate dehydrogenase